MHEIYKRLDNDTIMIVIGDHGMTEEGNHGGETFKETNTVLFAI
jgi:GPI ethanolamine phosphate transferase 3 subunit O